MTFGSLFSGIGGLDLGLERAGLRCAWQVEIDSFCRSVLARHWPEVLRIGDVRNAGAHNLNPVDVVAGGFPCQDISYAGLGVGIHGSHSGLWFEFARIVRDLGPTIVLVENVPALLDRGLGDVLGSLADLGYDAEWSTISACAVGAPHVRQRLFIVAYTDGIDGRARLRDSIARAFRPLQAVHGFEGSRARWRSRLANPSELYRDADGVPDRPQRNWAVGNAVVPDVAEWIGRRLMAVAELGEVAA